MHELLIATRGDADDARALGEAALANRESGGAPDRVTVEGVTAEEPVWLWRLGL